MPWLSTLLWCGLAASALLSAVGVFRQAPRLLVSAAVLSGAFSVAALFSIGIVILPICLAQLVLARRMRRAHVATHHAPMAALPDR